MISSIPPWRRRWYLVRRFLTQKNVFPGPLPESVLYLGITPQQLRELRYFIDNLGWGCDVCGKWPNPGDNIIFASIDSRPFFFHEDCFIRADVEGVLAENERI